MKKNSQQDVENELIVITRQLLNESGEPYQRQIKLDASLHSHLGIDSLGRAELFQRIEKSFNVRISDSLLAEAETLNDIAKYLLQSESQILIPSKHEILTSHGDRLNVNASQAATLIDVLLLYGEKSPQEIHIYFQNEDGVEETITYGQLLNSALRIAKSLRALGLENGETVAIMQPTHPRFFYTFFGILLAGGIPVPIYPPFRMNMLEAYARTEARILSNAAVRILVTFDKAETLSRLLKSFVPSLKHVTTVDELMQPDELAHPFHAHSNHSALIQYTSGSTADPKGVLLTHSNLLSNIRAYGKAIAVTPEDVAVSWLPLYHDMGLIGMWLGSLYYGVPLILMSPFSFLNHPERWLWAIHYHRGTISAAPNFAYELCIRKIETGLLEGLDLSSWRIAANGAEKIYPATLQRFAEKFAPYGFKRKSLLPVYGMAESAVGLAIPPINRDFLVDSIARQPFEEQCIATPSTEKNGLAFVSCGLPIDGHEIQIVDEENNVLQERVVGSLQFRGPSIMQGYFNSPKATQAIYHDGWLDSGDLAYKANGEIYITGRRKDLIIKAGRNLYPAELEELTERVQGVRKGCVVAFEVIDAERATEQLIVAAETQEKNKEKRNEIIEAIKETIVTALDIVPDHVILVAPHIIPKTSSGKLQRAACKKLYMEGHLGKMKMPASLQVIKLFALSMLRQCWLGVIFAARFCYTLYVALLVALTFLPMYFLVRITSRDTAAIVVKQWAKWIMRFSFCPIKLVGGEKLSSSSVIYTLNHSSYIDSLVMVVVLPTNARIVVKKEVFSMPLIRTIMKKLDYLGIDRLDFSKGVEDTKRIQQALKTGNPIVIFPEGTFGYAAGLRPFRLGAFKVAIETHTPVCPIAVKGTRYILRNNEKLMTPGRVTVTVCDVILPEGTEWQDVTKLRNTVRKEIMKYCGEPSLDFIAGHTIADTQKR